MKEIVVIRKVRVMSESIRQACRKDGMTDNDLVLVRCTHITGSPMDWLEKHVLKRQDDEQEQGGV